jgi:hypothetical protein
MSHNGTATSTPPDSVSQRHERLCAGERTQGVAEHSDPGLVRLQTTGHWSPRNPEIAQEMRLSRMRRGVGNAAAVIHEQATKGGFRHRVAMFTATYRQVGQWRSDHLKECLRHIRRWVERRGHTFRYVWVAELQSRGAVHYHVLIWLPRGLTLPKPDKQGWWTHGSTRIEWARRAVSYVMKYASKGYGMHCQFPRGLRLHGRGGLDEAQRSVVRWWLLPRYVRQYFTEIGTRVSRAAGGGWLHAPTGEWIPGWSPLREAPA